MSGTSIKTLQEPRMRLTSLRKMTHPMVIVPEIKQKFRLSVNTHGEVSAWRKSRVFAYLDKILGTVSATQEYLPKPA